MSEPIKPIELKDRLAKIIHTSYELFCHKVAAGSFIVCNEATLQHEFGMILHSIGKQYEFSANEHFSIEFEYDMKLKWSTAKSPKQNSRCDLLLIFSKEKEVVKAAIELKYFIKDPNEAVTDNRFSFYMDLENLEAYSAVDKTIALEYAFLYTDNENYTTYSKEDSKFIMAEGYVHTLKNDNTYTQNRTIHLKNEYKFHWDKYESCVRKDKNENPMNDSFLLMSVPV